MGYVAVNETYLSSPLGGSWRRVQVLSTTDLYTATGDSRFIWVGGEGIILQLAKDER